ncbi:MAG: esterase family protein [Clostridia bacterium]|nr:esterase family protein [Clostridia bacterium]
MILCDCNFFSKTLENHVSAQVLLPSMFDNDALFADLNEIYRPRKFPALYLLHGALEDETSWLRMTAIERYAQKRQIAVVMPRGQNGFYTNAESGLNYYDFVADELPRLIEYAFPISDRAEDRFIAGCSMGGYGAARCALGRPDRYAAFADLSGAVDPAQLEPAMTAMGFTFFRYDLLFGGAERVKGTTNDLWLLAERARFAAKKPRAFIYCGESDGNNYAMNHDLYGHLRTQGFETEFIGGEGDHDWEYWDGAIKDFLGRIG